MRTYSHEEMASVWGKRRLKEDVGLGLNEITLEESELDMTLKYK